MIHPKVLLEAGIRLRKTVQNPGEFIVIRDRAYHAGFNAGFNIAEAVNFATTHWLLKSAWKTSFCLCNGDSVRLNLLELSTDLLSQKLPRSTRKSLEKLASRLAGRKRSKKALVKVQI